jgi:uncharacterized membrane protein YdcZ (DUF606 family)
MPWCAVAAGYAGLGYWYFRAVLRNCRSYDGIGTVLLNAALAFAVGPVLLVLVLVIGTVEKRAAAGCIRAAAPRF